MNVHVNIHERQLSGGLGSIVYSEQWGAEVIPRVGELLTIHDELGSLSAEVTGVQHVWHCQLEPRRMTQVVIVTAGIT